MSVYNTARYEHVLIPVQFYNSASSQFPIIHFSTVRPNNNNAIFIVYYRNFKNIHELKLTIFAPKNKSTRKKTEVKHPKSSRKADLSVKIKEKISNSLLHLNIKFLCTLSSLSCQ